MCKNDPKVSELPRVLEDLVYMFAFNMPKEPVEKGLNTVLEVKSWNLPFWFLNNRIWSWHYRSYIDSPTKAFMPIEYFGGDYKDLFNIDVIYCFLAWSAPMHRRLVFLNTPTLLYTMFSHHRNICCVGI